MDERERIRQAIEALEGQRATLGDTVVDTALAPLREKLAALGAPAAEQRKQVTVLFADVSGFTAMSEHMDPEEVRDVMNILWNLLDTAITEYGGTIDKHIGDAVMALFGSPLAREDDPERAIRAALDMLAVFQDVAGELGAGGRPLGMRIGIHTGPVILGVVGSTSEHTAMGDTVNLASRLEHAAPVGGVIISHDTYRHVRGVFDVDALPALRVKGKSEPIRTYRVDRAKPRAFRLVARGVEGIETRLVGRDGELRLLQDGLREVMAEGCARCFTVVGEAGIGKSRLLWAFTESVELLPEQVRLFRARVTQQTGRLPYAILRDLLFYRFEIQESDSTAVAREKLARGLGQLMEDGAEEAASFLGHLAGVPHPDSPHLRGILEDARQLRDRALQNLVRLLEAATRAMPVVMILEDLHWADEGSLDLVESLMSRCRDLPLMVVCAARPLLLERRPAWGEAAPTHRRVHLGPLTAADTGRLVEEILQRVPDVPQFLGQKLADAAEGNPFYVEELIKMLIDDGVIRTGETWSVETQRLPDLRVPPTLTAVVQARLDALSPDERWTLQRASVLGRVFWDEALGALDQGSAGDVSAVLDSLCRRDLVFRRQETAFSDTREYAFKHAILHEVTYETVLLRLRRTYHRRSARWLVERAGEQRDAYAGVIAQHWESAGDAGEACAWYRRVARRAQETYALGEADACYRKALALLPPGAGDPHDRVDLQEGLGTVLLWKASYAEALDVFAEIEKTARASNDTRARARAAIDEALAHHGLGNYRTALERADRAGDLASEAGDDGLVVEALLQQGWCHVRLGAADTAEAMGSEAQQLAAHLGANRQAAQSFLLLSAASQLLGSYDRSARHGEAALSLFREIGDRDGTAGSLIALGETARLSGDYTAATGLYQKALEAYRQMGVRAGEINARSNLGGARVALGEWEEAEALLRDVVTEAPEGWFGLPETYRFLAEALLGQGRTEAALDTARRALTLGETSEAPELVGPAWRVLGEVAAALGAPAAVKGEDRDATFCFAESARILGGAGMAAERARTRWAWAQYELGQGDRERGKELWAEAQGDFARLGMNHEVERMGARPRNQAPVFR